MHTKTGEVVDFLDTEDVLFTISGILQDDWEVATKKEILGDLTYDQEDAMDHIRKNLREDHEAEITEGLLRAILDLEEDYMRSVGIIED